MLSMLHATGMPLGDGVVTSSRNFADGSVEDTNHYRAVFQSSTLNR